MSRPTPRMSDRLRQAVEADLRPVEPLPPPWRRVLWALPVIVAVGGVAFLHFGFRPDIGELGLWLAWVPLLMQATLGLALLAIALHEAVPGLRLPRAVVVACAAGALGVHLVVNLLLWMRHPVGYGDFVRSWWPCLSHELLLGAPFLAVTTYLAARALPMQPRLIGLLSGVGGGVIADASWRLVCPVSAPAHFLAAHLGGVVVLGTAGYLLGMVIELRRRPA